MPTLNERLDRTLNPRVVAVVGDKRASGYMWLRNLKPFTGTVYSVQIDPNDIPGIEEMGIANYPSLTAIPEDVDYVICAVPRQVAPRVLQDAAQKGVGGVGMFTSGFAETGEELGINLQNEVRRIAREHDLLLIGPNCMGLYNPRLGVRFSADQPAGEAGSVGLISQSGTHAINISLIAAANGVRLSKAVSIGNAVILDVPDYLEYFGQDDQTKAIALYVEGVKDGQRFARVLREVAARKPVLIWKGGQTPDGARATQSHTASLSSQIGIWDALIRQAGAIRVDSVEEMIDTLKLLLLAKPGAGRRLALMAHTGGPSVVITDAFTKAGFAVPELSPASYEELSTFFNVIGGSYRNPFDMGGTIGGPQGANLDRLFDILERDENIDAVVMDVAAMFLARQFIDHPERLEEFTGRLLRHRDRSAKPFLTILNPGHLEADVLPVRRALQERDIPVLPSFERAATALARVTAYHDRD
ncbi:MAG: CoA-binding protein, partial [Dehalococcoidia bacterium]